MSGFACAHSGQDQWRAACDECLERLPVHDPAPGRERLAFVYVTDPFGPHLGAIVNHLREASGITHWVGSVGLGICAENREYFSTAALAVLVAELPTESFRVFGSISGPWDEFDAAHGPWCREHEPYFGFVHGDPQNPALPDLVESLAARVSSGFVVGGLTSAQTAMIQVADKPTSGGISGVLLAPEVPVVTRLSQGCSPIGERHEVTACERNIIVELDGRPALDVFKEEIGEILARDLRRAAGYIFVGLPIAGSDTGDYLVRNLVGVDPRTGVVAVGEMVSPGQSLIFCRRDVQSAADDMRRMLGEIDASTTGPAQAGVYYSCLARGPNLFGENSEEVNMIRDALGEFPLIGFFANGEISHSRLYAYTGVLTLFTG